MPETMPRLLFYARSRSTSVEPVDDQTMRSTCRLQDTLTHAVVEILVKLPDLEIIEAHGEFRRTYQDECRNPAEGLKKVIGVRVGPGMLKIIKGLVGEVSECRQLAFMVEECCHGIILAFTKEELAHAPVEQHQNVEYYRKMIKDNIRLYSRCAAFAPGSSMVEGIESPTK